MIATTPVSCNKQEQSPQHSCSFCFSVQWRPVEVSASHKRFFYCRISKRRYVCLCMWICRIYCMCDSSWFNRLIIILLRSPPSSSFHIHAHTPPKHYVASLSQAKLRSRPQWLNNTNNKYAAGGGGTAKDELPTESSKMAADKNTKCVKGITSQK